MHCLGHGEVAEEILFVVGRLQANARECRTATAALSTMALSFKTGRAALVHLDARFGDAGLAVAVGRNRVALDIAASNASRDHNPRAEIVLDLARHDRGAEAPRISMPVCAPVILTLEMAGLASNDFDARARRRLRDRPESRRLRSSPHRSYARSPAASAVGRAQRHAAGRLRAQHHAFAQLDAFFVVALRNQTRYRRDAPVRGGVDARPAPRSTCAGPSVTANRWRTYGTARPSPKPHGEGRRRPYPARRG